MKFAQFSVFLAAAISLATVPTVAFAEGPATPAEAAPAVSTEFIVLHGTNDGTGIDPKIGKMPELGKPPFSAYNSYKLLEKSTAASSKAKASTTKLPNGAVLKVALKEVLEPKKKGEAKKFVMSASIQKPGGNTFLPMLEVNAKAGETFFVAGPTYKGGILVIAIKVTP